MAYIQAGAGVVADSTPEDEYQETVNKATGMMRAIERANAVSGFSAFRRLFVPRDQYTFSPATALSASALARSNSWPSGLVMSKETLSGGMRITPGSSPFQRRSIFPRPPAMSISRMAVKASTPSLRRTKFGSGMVPKALVSAARMPRRVAMSWRRKLAMAGERPLTRSVSVKTRSLPPSKVRPRRRKVLEPTSAQTSSTMTTVDSSRLGRPGKPTGWNETTRESDRARMRVRRSSASCEASGS